MGVTSAWQVGHTEEDYHLFLADGGVDARHRGLWTQETHGDNTALKWPQRLIKISVFLSVEIFILSCCTVKMGRDIREVGVGLGWGWGKVWVMEGAMVC